MNGRIYSPKLGRMLSPDPVTQAPENGQNYDRYTYALNNPLKYKDPSGYKSEEDAKAACEGDSCTNNSNAASGFLEHIVVTAERGKKRPSGNQGSTVGSLSGSAVPIAKPGDRPDSSSGEIQENEYENPQIDCNLTPEKCVAAELNQPETKRNPWSFSIGLSGTFFSGTMGGRLSGSYGIDSAGKVCRTESGCGLTGLGVDAGPSVVITLSATDFVEGDNQVGAGLFYSAGPFTVYVLDDGTYVVEIASPRGGGGVALCLANVEC